MEYRLANQGRVFSTRDRGEKTRADFCQKLGHAPIESATIDLGDVLSLSYSFVDEFIGELVASQGSPRIANASAETARTIERSLRTRGLASAVADAGILHAA